MVKLILKPLTDGDQDVVIEKGKTILGRGTLLNVSVLNTFFDYKSTLDHFAHDHFPPTTPQNAVYR